MLRPEQKSVLLCKEIISRYSKPNVIVVDLFARTFFNCSGGNDAPRTAHILRMLCRRELCRPWRAVLLTAFLWIFLLQPERALDRRIFVHDSIKSAALAYHDLSALTQAPPAFLLANAFRYVRC